MLMSARAVALAATVALLPVVSVAPRLGAQTSTSSSDRLAFEVASVKSNKSGSLGSSIGRQAGGRWRTVNVSAAGLVRTAFPSKASELVGAPDWLTSERYDVDARAPFEPTNEQVQVMLRALLADRFKLTAHYEARERPVYNLVVARADGQLGPRIHRIDVDCATYKPQPAGRAASEPSPSEPPPCSYSINAVTTLTMISGGRDIETLANALFGMAGRPVLDKTGLPGYYAFTLENVGENDGVSVFTALEEQLGLKLVAARAPLDVLVIDHVEPPTPD